MQVSLAPPGSRRNDTGPDCGPASKSSGAPRRDMPLPESTLLGGTSVVTTGPAHSEAEVLSLDGRPVDFGLRSLPDSLRDVVCG